MTRAVTTQHRRAIERARETMLRTAEKARIQNEVVWAKQIQEQTGCTWTEALRAAYRGAAAA